MEAAQQPHPENLSPELSKPQLSKPPSIQLTSTEEALIRAVHRDYDRLILEKEFHSGYSAARVFLVLPVKPDGGSDARMVTKIILAEELQREKANFDEHVKHALPFIGTQVGAYYEQDGLAALNYVFAGGEGLGEAVSLEGYCAAHSAEDVIKTLQGLLNVLGSRWYSQGGPLNCTLREEYGRHLPAHAELERITARIFPMLILLEDDQFQIPGIPGRYPHPLKVYPRLLDQVLQGRQSYVHGDLHLRNVLVDEVGKGWLIDFAKVRQRHNLFDFIKLEAYIRLMALATVHSSFSHKEYLQFEAALNDTRLKPPDNQELRAAYRTISAIRKMASDHMRKRTNLREEYLPALFLYCLALMKYHPVNGDIPTQLMFLTCCAVGKYLQGGDDIIVITNPNPAGTRSLKWWGIRATITISILTLMAAVGFWLSPIIMPFSNAPAPTPSVTQALIPASTSISAPTQLAPDYAPTENGVTQASTSIFAPTHLTTVTWTPPTATAPPANAPTIIKTSQLEFQLGARQLLWTQQNQVLLGGYGLLAYDPTHGSQTPIGEEHWITSMAVSPDGKTLAVSVNQAVKLYDVATGIDLDTLPIQSVSTQDLAFSPDGKSLVIVDSSRGVIVWNLASKSEAKPFSEPAIYPETFAFSLDGRLLAVGGWNEGNAAKIVLWDLNSGQWLRTFTGHENTVNAVAFSPDGRWLVSGSADLTIRLWDVSNGNVLNKLTGHTTAVNAVAFSPDGKMLASGGDDGVIFWEIKTQ
jgi:sugar lactone lactonase YvrE